MSNLGKYQTMTTLAKKVGGPDVLGAITLGLGAAAVGAAWGIKELVQLVKREKSYINSDGLYKIIKHGTSADGIRFEVGDRFRVLDEGPDFILIEIIGNINNPYVVDPCYIKGISNFR